jgi:hypothetical protein
LLNNITESINLCVGFFLPVEKLASGGLPEGSDHAESGISIVTSPVARIHYDEYLAFIKAVDIMMTPLERIGNPGKLPRDPASALSRTEHSLGCTPWMPKKASCYAVITAVRVCVEVAVSDRLAVGVIGVAAALSVWRPGPPDGAASRWGYRAAPAR